MLRSFERKNLMRFVRESAVVAVVLFLVPTLASAQAQEDASHAVRGGGIFAHGWQGQLDPGAKESVNDAKLIEEGGGLHVTTGPAITYWNPANTASGDYTVSATFTEPKFMNLNTHPHPYGIVIAGNDMGTPQQTELYRAAYGSGNFIVRGFGPAPFALNGRREANAAVHKAEAPGQPVTQTIAMSVKGNSVECIINGTMVASYDKSLVVAAGKLKSTDGVYGIRFAHNTEGTVTDLKVTRP
jgi:hypothetical protein